MPFCIQLKKMLVMCSFVCTFCRDCRFKKRIMRNCTFNNYSWDLICEGALSSVPKIVSITTRVSYR